MTELSCSVVGCEREVRARGWCSTHYARWQHGRPVNVAVPSKPEPASALIRTLRRVDLVGSCWRFTGGLDAHGYGQVSSGSRATGTYRNRKAHQVVFEALVGSIPEGLELDHLCRYRACVNPGHLEPVTHSENARRAYARRAA